MIDFGPIVAPTIDLAASGPYLVPSPAHLVQAAPKSRRVLVATVQATVAKYFGITVAAMVSASREREVLRPRQIAMHLCVKYSHASENEIGRRFGGRDHTCVRNAVRLVAKLRREDPAFDADVRALERMFEGVR